MRWKPLSKERRRLTVGNLQLLVNHVLSNLELEQLFRNKFLSTSHFLLLPNLTYSQQQAGAEEDDLCYVMFTPCSAWRFSAASLRSQS